MGVIGFFTPMLFLFRRLHWAVRFLFGVLLSFAFLSIVGAFVSFVVHSTEIGLAQLFGSVLSDVPGGVAYFTETGWETGVLWLPTLTLGMIFAASRKRD